MRPVDPTRGPGFALEAFDGVRHRQDLVAEELDRHALAETYVLGLEDDAHAALAELTKQAVLASDPVAGCDVHGHRVHLSGVLAATTRARARSTSSPR